MVRGVPNNERGVSFTERGVSLAERGVSFLVAPDASASILVAIGKDKEQEFFVPGNHVVNKWSCAAPGEHSSTLSAMVTVLRVREDCGPDADLTDLALEPAGWRMSLERFAPDLPDFDVALAALGDIVVGELRCLLTLLHTTGLLPLNFFSSELLVALAASSLAMALARALAFNDPWTQLMFSGLEIHKRANSQ